MSCLCLSGALIIFWNIGLCARITVKGEEKFKCFLSIPRGKERGSNTTKEKIIITQQSSLPYSHPSWPWNLQSCRSAIRTSGLWIVLLLRAWRRLMSCRLRCCTCTVRNRDLRDRHLHRLLVSWDLRYLHRQEISYSIFLVENWCLAGRIDRRRCGEGWLYSRPYGIKCFIRITLESCLFCGFHRLTWSLSQACSKSHKCNIQEGGMWW